MKNTKRKWLSIALLVVFCFALVLMTSCDTKPETPTDYGIDGIYYMEDLGREYLFTITGNQFLLSGLNGEQSGTFTYAEGTLTLTFRGDNSVNASATLENGVLKLTYNGNSYRLLSRQSFTVSFVDGNGKISSAKVLNGASVQKPQDPAKDGYAFLGWYADAAFTTSFAFDSTVITKDTTVYARFEELTGSREYTVSFDVDGAAAYGKVTTVNGVVYNLPVPEKQGATFVGWWISDYQSADKLTAQYTGQTLTEDTTLYAVFADGTKPMVSVDASGVTWNEGGVNPNYRVVITFGDTKVAEVNAGSATKYAYDFANAEAGDYVITVTLNGVSGTVYYRNKALDRASNFRVIGSDILVFDPVEHADYYLITVLCGSEKHSHKAVNNGKSTNFNFSTCAMPAEGIRFRVTAVGDGFASSTSDEFVVSRTLDAVSDVKVSDSAITWSTVKNAVGYYVYISTDGGETFTKAYVTGATTYDISSLDAGALVVKVAAYTAGYYTPVADAVNYTKVAVATPGNIAVSDGKLTWDAVKGATGYVVEIDGKTYKVAKNELELTDEVLVAGKTSYTVRVSAAGDDANTASPFSAASSVKYLTMGSVRYSNGFVYWDPVIGATSYDVILNGKSVSVSASKSSLAIAFSKAGENRISVRYYDEDYEVSRAVEITVTVGMIELDTRGGSAVANLYLALGDDIVLPSTGRDGYDFAGWYKSPDAIFNNGVAFGDIVYANDTVDILFANWEPKRYTITLVPGDGTVESTTATVIYGQENKLPVAKPNAGTKLFAGWYTESDGAGIRYFDENGNALKAWLVPGDVTLYAYYSEVMSFTPINNGTEYSVSKGPFGIGTLTSITVPATYNDLPVTTVEAEAFVSCSTLVEINIPDTIKSIECGKDGIYGTGSAFKYCSKLEAINIYHVEGNNDIVYSSDDGVLYYNNPYNGMEIKAYPYAKIGILEIKVGTVNIPAGALKSAKFTEVNIPYTVTNIDSQAFSSCSKLTKINFLTAPEGVDEVPLNLQSKAFSSCSNLTTIILPSRLASFSQDIFNYCNKLTSVDVSGTGGNFSAKGEAGTKVLCTAAGDKIVYAPKGFAGDYTIPAGVTAIGELAFNGCTGLTSLTITGSVKSIEANAFKGCTGLTKLTFTEDGAELEVGEGAFYGCTGLTALTLPSGLWKMEKNAFGYLSKVTSVTVNSKGVSDGDGGMKVEFAVNAFGTTSSTPSFYVTTLNLGKDVPTFDIAGVFGQKLVNVTVDKDNPYYTAQDNILYDKNITSILYYPSSRTGAFTLPDTVTTIGARVFQAKYGLNEITIGKNVTTIGEGAFYNCTALKKVTFAGGGTEKLVLGKGAFQSCTALTEITLPDRLSAIGEEAFRSCQEIVTIVVPEGVTTIGDSAFSRCSKLESVVLPSTLTSIGTIGSFNVFDSCGQLKTLVVTSTEEKPNHSYTTVDNILYKLTEVAGEKEGDAPTYVITDLMFCPQKKAGNSKVTVPGTVGNIYAKAFFLNSAVTEIEFQTLTAKSLTIGNQAFGSCKTLAKISLPEGLTSIPKSMLQNCASLVEIVIPTTVEKIENQAFASCTSLSKVTFTPGGTKSLEIVNASSYIYSPFYNCKSLYEITFPERTTKLGNYVFGGNYTTHDGISSVTSSAIRKVTLPSTLESIGNYAFNYALYLESVTFAPKTALKDASKTVPAIGNYAFRGCAKLTSITLPETITEGATYSIGEYAFNNSGLVSFVVPASVSEVKGNAFYGAKSLTSFTAAPGCKAALGAAALQGTGVETVILPEGCTSIGNNCFYQCKKLTTISIPATVTELGNYAFRECGALRTVIFETYTDKDDGKNYSSLAKIGNTVFEKTALTTFTFPTLKTGYIKIDASGKLFNGCTLLTTVNLSKSVNNVENVFSGCSSIRTINIDSENTFFSMVPGSNILLNAAGTEYKYILGAIEGEHVVPTGIIKLPDSIFEGQFGLTKITIPSSVQSIGKNAFKGCSALTEVVILGTTDAPSQLTTIGEAAFSDCTALTTVTLPVSVKELSKSLFSGCTSLKSFVIPAAVTKIGDRAFYAAGLESIRVPATVTSLGQYAFATSTTVPGTLKSIIFDKDERGNTALKTINTYAFQYQALESIVIPKSVTSIMGSVFYRADSLKSVEFEAGTTIKQIYNSMFSNALGLESIVIPASVTEIGASAFNKCTSLRSITFEDSSLLTKIGNSAFAYTAIESITLPVGVTTLGATTFNGCENLKEVNFLGKVTFLGTETFKNCTALESFEIPETVTKLGNTATAAAIATKSGIFTGCTALKNVVLHNKLTQLSAYVFSGCTALETITIPASVTQLGAYTFEKCTALKTVVFADGSKLNALGASCFRGCTALESIVLPKGVTVLGTSATAGSLTSSAYQFAGCTSLKNVTFLGNVTLLGGYVFSGCTSLETVVFPESLKQIGKNCFENCTSLKSVTIPANVPAMTLGDKVFMNCSSLEAIALPDKCTEITNYAFQGCSSLREITFNKVVTIGVNAFDGCVALESIELPSTLKTIKAEAFYNTGLITIEIPANCTTVANWSNHNIFVGSNNLQRIDVNPANTAFSSIDGCLATADMEIAAVPPTKTGKLVLPTDYTLAGHALEGCLGITEVTLDAGMTEIADYALFGSGVTTVTIPAGVSAIGKYAFAGSKITSLIIPAAVETIGDNAFADCAELLTVTFADNSKFTTGGDALFKNDVKLQSIVIPDGTLYLGESETDTGWFGGCSGLTSVTLPSTLVFLNKSSFTGCSSLETITLPAGVTGIGANAFSASGIKSITLHEGITGIDSSAFENATSLTSVHIPASVAKLGAKVFMGCTSLASVTFADNGALTELPQYAFANSGLESIVVPAYITAFDSLTVTYGYTFDGCANLRSVTVLGEVKKVTGYMFRNCTSLKELVLPDTINEFGYYCFQGCGLESFTVKKDILTIASGVFQDCKSLKTVTFEEGCTQVGGGMFQGCDALTSVTLPNTVSIIYGYAFADCTALKEIIIPMSVSQISNYAFKGMTSAQTIRFRGSQSISVSWTNWNRDCDAIIVWDYQD